MTWLASTQLTSLMRNMLKRVRPQWLLLLMALSFYTRIPIKRDLPLDKSLWVKSRRYFPFVGALIACISTVGFIVFDALLTSTLTAVCLLALSVLITGALHEDGFADFFDGLGASDKFDILQIMKDSQIGVYACLSLLFLILVKYQALLSIIDSSSITVLDVFFMFLLIHVLSRWVVNFLPQYYEYAGDIATSKTYQLLKPLRSKDMWLMHVYVLVICVFACSNFGVFVIFLVGVNVLLAYVFSRYCYHRIQGFSGDCLGALQQLSECVIYVAFSVFSTTYYA